MSLARCYTLKETPRHARPLKALRKPVEGKSPTFPNNIERMKHEILHTYFTYRETDLEKWAKNFTGDRNKTVVHIAARAGSTRLPRKNIEPINGKPLIAYTIEVAKALKIDRIIVNTDDEEFAEIARHYGAETPFIRPAELSTNDCPPGLASFYALRHMLEEGYGVKSIIELYPTTPLRNVDKLNEYIAAMNKYGIANTCVFPEAHCGNIFSEGKHVPMAVDRIQEEAKIYYSPISTFMGHNILASERPGYATFPILNPLELIDIDSRRDMELLKYVLINNLYDFGRGL